jgi:hypothetical protein
MPIVLQERRGKPDTVLEELGNFFMAADVYGRAITKGQSSSDSTGAAESENSYLFERS